MSAIRSFNGTFSFLAAVMKPSFGRQSISPKDRKTLEHFGSNKKLAFVIALKLPSFILEKWNALAPNVILGTILKLEPSILMLR